MSRKSEVKAFIVCVAQDANIQSDGACYSTLSEMIYNILEKRDRVRNTNFIGDLLVSLDTGKMVEEYSRMIRIELCILADITRKNI